MIYIVGGSGFIGTRLSRMLASTDTPFKIIDKAGSHTFPERVSLADIRSLDELNRVLADGGILINLAAEHRDDVQPKSLYDEVNVLGAKNLCQAARNKGIQKIIFVSSVAVYGFAPLGTDESGMINPFNDYGRTKAEAELVFKAWQMEEPTKRTLVIVRPTVVFGEQNRGNVYNLLKQIASGRFVMIGDGKNRKSMAYVENIAAFLIHSLSFSPGAHLFNYIDKPDFTMNSLVSHVCKIMGKSEEIGFRIPYGVSFSIGIFFDFGSLVTGKRFAISSIRVKKFCSNSVYETSIEKTGFVPPVLLSDALARTIKFEFMENHQNDKLFYSE
jgi:nucleoside-diphosphate-sugar epimerase